MTANDGLDPENWGWLNREFYAAAPADYFRTRLYLLLAFAGRTDDLLDLFEEGVEYERIALSIRPRDPESTADDADEAERELQEYLVAESEVLYYHTSETVLRMYLAHEGFPDCPPLEVARRRFGFRDAIQGRFLSDFREDERRQQTAQVVLGQRVTSETTEESLQSIDSLEDALTTFARDFHSGVEPIQRRKTWTRYCAFCGCVHETRRRGRSHC